MAATAGVSPSHLLLEVEVEEMHVRMQCDSVLEWVGGNGRVSYCTHT
jgi:hypothetical protein